MIFIMETAQTVTQSFYFYGSLSGFSFFSPPSPAVKQQADLLAYAHSCDRRRKEQEEVAVNSEIAVLWDREWANRWQRRKYPLIPYEGLAHIERLLIGERTERGWVMPVRETVRWGNIIRYVTLKRWKDHGLYVSDEEYIQREEKDLLLSLYGETMALFWKHRTIGEKPETALQRQIGENSILRIFYPRSPRPRRDAFLHFPGYAILKALRSERTPLIELAVAIFWSGSSHTQEDCLKFQED